MDNDWIIKINDPGYKLTLDVYIFRKSMNGKIEVYRGGDIVETEDAGTAIKPSLELDRGTLQEFADALDRQGIKPQKGFIEGKLAATENHLADMRKLLKLP